LIGKISIEPRIYCYSNFYIREITLTGLPDTVIDRASKDKRNPFRGDLTFLHEIEGSFQISDCLAPHAYTHSSLHPP
jgi:hypothetical protein